MAFLAPAIPALAEAGSAAAATGAAAGGTTLSTLPAGAGVFGAFPAATSEVAPAVAAGLPAVQGPLSPPALIKLGGQILPGMLAGSKAPPPALPSTPVQMPGAMGNLGGGAPQAAGGIVASKPMSPQGDQAQLLMLKRLGLI